MTVSGHFTLHFLYGSYAGEEGPAYEREELRHCACRRRKSAVSDVKCAKECRDSGELRATVASPPAHSCSKGVLCDRD